MRGVEEGDTSWNCVSLKGNTNARHISSFSSGRFKMLSSAGEPGCRVQLLLG